MTTCGDAAAVIPIPVAAAATVPVSSTSTTVLCITTFTENPGASAEKSADGPKAMDIPKDASAGINEVPYDAVNRGSAMVTEDCWSCATTSVKSEIVISATKLKTLVPASGRTTSMLSRPW